MGWPFKFLTLDEAARHERRVLLDRYALYAQLSVLIPLAGIFAYRFASGALVAWQKRQVGAYDAIPASPTLKSRRRSSVGTWVNRRRQWTWWWGNDFRMVGMRLGTNGEWVFGIGWLSWLLLMCVLQTGQDYLHVTKRFGMIAVSQLPLHYILSSKSITPFSYIFSSSHEQINAYHRVMGRVISLLLVLHVIFYLNYFIQVGILFRRLSAPIVIYGVLAFTSLSLLYLTALAPLRNYSYRLFFIVHLAASLAMPLLIWFHAPHVRIYLGEAVLAFLLDIASRRLDQFSAMATVESIAGTDLVKVVMPVPYEKTSKFRAHSGVHVYMRIPPSSRPTKNLVSWDYQKFEAIFNPYSIAAMDDTSGQVTMIMRILKGPMSKTLQEGADSMGDNHHFDPDHVLPTAPSRNSHNAGKMMLSIQGPYGVAAYFPRLADFDRVLLVSGGIGATFTIPIYRALTQDIAQGAHVKLRLIWAIRTASEATWAISPSSSHTPTSTSTTTTRFPSGSGRGRADSTPAFSSGKSLIDDENVHIFLTGEGPADDDTIRSSISHNTNDSFSSDNNNNNNNMTADAGVELSAMYSDSRRRSPSLNQRQHHHHQQENIHDTSQATDTEAYATTTTTSATTPYSHTTLHNRRRPDLKRIVDETFKHGSEERVAVLFCGPAAMGRELRTHVGQWVERGRDVFWHSEDFGW